MNIERMIGSDYMDPLKILLVDDEEDLLLTLESAVKAEGYNTLRATNGKEALYLALNERPDLVLMDVMMPEMDGLEACRKIKATPATANLPVIFLSAHDLPKAKVEGFDSGGYDYITKPLNYDELFARLRSFRREHDYRKKINAMMEFSREINILEFDQLIERMEKKIGGIFRSDYFSIFLWDAERKILTLAADNRRNLNDIKDLDLPLADTPLMKEVIETENIVHVKEFRNSKYCTEKRESYADDYALCIPLKMGDKTIGVLNLNGNTKGFFNNPDFTFMHLGAEHITSALSNSLQYKKIQEMAVTDHLTRLFNRRFFFERLSMEWDRWQRYGSKMSVIMVDIDFFKKVNDTYGHMCGDKILVETADMMRKHTRKIDIVARYGGEEFILLLPETAKPEAIKVADRIRKDMESETHQCDVRTFGVTLSMGVEDSEGAGIRHQDDIVRLVDEKLYKAKLAGRNRVVS